MEDPRRPQQVQPQIATELLEGNPNTAANAENSVRAATNFQEESSCSDCECEHDHSPPVRSVFGGTEDPADLSTVPASFYSLTEFQDRPFLRDPDEMKYIRCVIASFFNYRNDSFRDLAKTERDFIRMKSPGKELVKPFLEERFDQMRMAINHNYIFLCHVVQEYESLFTWRQLSTGDTYLPAQRIKPSDVSKLRSTLRQIVREWSEEGQVERDAAYLPLVKLLEAEYPDIANRPQIKAVTDYSGSGLGRLAFDFACKGFSAQANEFSYFMLLVGNFILNRIEKKDSYFIYPRIHCPNNKLTKEDFFKPTKFPDVNLPELLHPDADFSMVAGEFEEVYSKDPESWDAVATCFFIDTAHNIVDYLLTIHKILKPGETPGEDSIELTWEEVLHVAKQIGFDIELEDNVRSTYCSVGQPMLETVYISKLIKARKRLVKGST